MESGLDNLKHAAACLRAAKNVVVFTGAGISAESGIPTFRDSDGLWQRFSPERFATWDGLLKTAVADPRLFADFLIAVLDPIAVAAPNAGHLAVAELERHLPVTVITQNVDGLHQAAGSTTVHEVHGSIFEIVTLGGRFVRLLSRAEVREIVQKLREAREATLVLPKALRAIHSMLGPGGVSIHRPKIVLFGEAMAEPAWTLAQEAAEQCDCMITVGTSATVMPAAMLPGIARSVGARVIDVSIEPGDADFPLTGPAASVLPDLVRKAFR
ncbi:MAG: iron dicitrate transport regulator FecR [Planctomycetes bacterium]|nr:iron dicitrate transport regulator FecR [Planctomycetota bacterium]